MKELSNIHKLIGLLIVCLLSIGCTTIQGEAEAVAQAEPTVAPLPTATPRPTVEAVVISEPLVAEREQLASTTFVQWVKDDSPAEGSESTLIRMPHGVYITLDAVGLEPGDAYTMWWVIMNRPENCTDGECGLDDGFLLDDQGKIILVDGEPQMNWEGRAAADFSVQRATGTIVDADGTAEFRAHLAVGDAIEAIFGGEGIDDAYKAEIHVVIRSHGQAIPGQIHDQMNTPWGGCPEGWPKTPCRNVMFAIHRVATAD